jgi:hypothetical protein
MTAEKRLRDLLRSEATTIVPTGDGLAKIRERIARRRRARLWLLPSAALATAAAAAAFFVFTPDDRRTQTLQPGGTPTATTSEAPTPAATATNGPQTQPSDSWQGPAFWPFASAADLQSVADPVPAWMQDSLQIGQRLVRDVLQLPDVTVVQTCVSCEVLGLKVGTADVGQIQLGHYTVHGTRVFTVVDITGTDLTITSPSAGTAIVSPTRVTGRVTGVDEHVNLRLFGKDGSGLAQGGEQAGSAVPWSVTLTWSAQDWSTGAILGVTGNLRDGAINRVVLVPVSRGTGTTTSSFAGIVDGHAALFDSSSGKQLRQLTYPPSGKTDTVATWSLGTLAWVRTASASACVNELDRLDGTKASTVATSTSVRFGWPQLSADADRLAWVETPCAGTGPEQLVLTVNGTEARRLTGPSGSVMNLFDVADDGALLLTTNDQQATGPGTIGILPAGAGTLDDLVALAPASGCYLASDAAFDGDQVLAFETCGSTVRLVRYDLEGKRRSADPAFASESPQTIRVRDGLVLSWLFGGDHYGEIARYRSGAFTTLITNSGCSSISDLKGCVRDPDW